MRLTNSEAADTRLVPWWTSWNLGAYLVPQKAAYPRRVPNGLLQFAVQ